MKRRTLACLLALLSMFMALPVASARADDNRTALFLWKYDVDSSSVAYCRMEGLGGDPFAGNIPGPGPRIKTTGSSTSVAAVTAGTNPFALLSVGDAVVVRRSATTGAVDVVVITVKTDADNVTVDAAVDWSTDAQGNVGTAFSWRKTVCGTTASDGWIDLHGATGKLLVVEFNQGDIASLEWRVEGRVATPLGYGAAVELYPGTATTCGRDGTVVSGYCDFVAAKAGLAGRHAVFDLTPWDSFRLGFKYLTSDTSDAGANLEQVTAYIVVSQIAR